MGGKTVQFIPKGGMCIVCRHRNNDCSHINFEDATVIKKPDDETVIVRCPEFYRIAEMTQ